MSPSSGGGAVTADRPEKIARVTRILRERGLEAVRLSSGESLAWLLDGARTAVPLGGAPVFSARVDRDGGVRVTAPHNEAERLAAEEIGGEAIDVVDWFAPFVDARPGEVPESELAADLRAARASLLPAERERYRALGADTARALTETLSTASPDETEHALAARLSQALLERGVEPAVLLVAGASRAHVQHPLPTRARLGDRAMLVATGRRHGLHASATRWVRFRGREPEAAALVREVEADAWAASRAGRALSEVLADIAASYERHGLGADAWMRHHQGGPTGYAGRDPKATPSSPEVVQYGQAFAWNPWVPAAKAEDTVVIDPDGAVEVLTADPAWPTADVRGVAHPDTLDRA